MIALRASDGSKVRGYADKLRSAVARAPSEEPLAVAPTLARMLDTYYDARQSPDGQPWVPRVSGGSWPLLEKTGRMRRSRTLTIGAGFLTIGYDSPGEHHNDGTSRMAARKLLPHGSLSRPLSLAIGVARLEWWRDALGAA